MIKTKTNQIGLVFMIITKTNRICFSLRPIKASLYVYLHTQYTYNSYII